MGEYGRCPEDLGLVTGASCQLILDAPRPGDVERYDRERGTSKEPKKTRELANRTSEAPAKQ
jgi:hypothetical protein